MMSTRSWSEMEGVKCYPLLVFMLALFWMLCSVNGLSIQGHESCSVVVNKGFLLLGIGPTPTEATLFLARWTLRFTCHRCCPPHKSDFKTEWQKTLLVLKVDSLFIVLCQLLNGLTCFILCHILQGGIFISTVLKAKKVSKPTTPLKLVPGPPEEAWPTVKETNCCTSTAKIVLAL